MANITDNPQPISHNNAFPGLEYGAQNSSRKLIQWAIPNAGIVEMYINPQSLVIKEQKIIKETRTKGGYIIQYWGEQLPEVTIDGVTGSAGVEGINILRDIYRQEQIGFGNLVSQMSSGFMNDLFSSTISSLQSLSNFDAISTIQSAQTSINQISSGFSGNDPQQVLSGAMSAIGNVANVLDSIGGAVGGSVQLIPTLGAFATAVELMYDGLILRGYFKSFTVTERAEQTGMFSYNMIFMVTRRSGVRMNGFPWQRSPNYGPANSDNIPLSFGALAQSPIAIATPTANAPTTIVSTSRRSLLTGG
jgi:hypothetical protein